MTRRLRTLAAVVALISALIAAACQGGNPDPAPTAVLPTPVVPSSSDSTPPPDDREVEEALGVYSDGHHAFEEMSVAGGDPDATAVMSDYYSGAFLDLQVLTLKQIHDDGLVQDGQAELVAVIDPTAKLGGTVESFEFTACINFENVEVTAPDGNVLQRGFQVSEDTVTMVVSDGRWTANDVRSQVGESFTGNCAAVTRS